MKRHTDADNTSRTRILDAAEKLFAEKSFDGARVDEIAERSGLNKSQIYYYFESKDALLDALFDRFSAAVEAGVKEAILGIARDLQSKELPPLSTIKPFFSLFIEFLEPRRDMLKIALTEGMKADPGIPRLFPLIKKIISMESQATKDLGIPMPDELGVAINETFTALLPLAGFIVYHDKFMEQFGVDEATLKKRFVELLYASHSASSALLLDPPGGPAPPRT